MLPSSRHAARSREARRRPAGGAPGLPSGAGRLISVVRPASLLAITLICLGPTRVVFCQDEVRWKRPAPEEIAEDLARTADAFGSCEPDSVNKFLGETVMVGPRLWQIVQPFLEDSPDRGATVVLLLEGGKKFEEWGLTPLDLSQVAADKRGVYEELAKAKNRIPVQAGAFRGGAPTAAGFLSLILKRGTNLSIREASPGEILYYWALVPYDLEGTLITLEFDGAKLFFDLGTDHRCTFFEWLP